MEETTIEYIDWRDPTEVMCEQMKEKIVDDLQTCCKTPKLAIQGEWYDQCLEINKGRPPCHILSCVMEKSKVIQFIIHPEVRPTFLPEGLIESFMLSVNETRENWQPVVRRSVNRCYEDFEGSEDGYDCDETSPKIIFDVAYCTMKELFLKCPNFNPDRIENCPITYQWVEQCWY